MLLGGACQIRPAANRHCAAPDDIFAALHRAREYLVFQIAVQQRSIGREPQHLAGFSKRTPERLLAGDADEFRPARAYQPMNLAHGIEPREIRHQNPHRVDVAGNQHCFERREGPARAELERVRLCRQRLPVGRRRTVNPGDRDVAHGDQGLEVKVGNETRTDEADAERVDRCIAIHENFPPRDSLRRSGVRSSSVAMMQYQYPVANAPRVRGSAAPLKPAGVTRIELAEVGV